MEPNLTLGVWFQKYFKRTTINDGCHRNTKWSAMRWVNAFLTPASPTRALLTGISKTSGDAFAAASLEAILTDRSVLDCVDTRTGVFRVLYGIWASAGAPVEEGEKAVAAKAQKNTS